MRYVGLSAELVVAGCADGTPTSMGRNDAPLASLASVSEAAPPTVFNTQLRAEQEPNNASTSESKGFAQIAVLADGTIEFILVINNKSDETYTRAHIHKAAAGVNGPIHWDFLEAGVPVASIGDQPATLRGVARAHTGADLSDLVSNPDQYYVNVHSTVFLGGAIRGQLR